MTTRVGTGRMLLMRNDLDAITRVMKKRMYLVSMLF